MNKRGFTLVELLAVIAILAIIIIVAVPTFNKYVINSEVRYYKTLEKSVKTAGMEYMNENSNFLPKEVGYYSTVGEERLKKSGIIENITDSEGKPCERVEVIVKKNKNSDYEYETCLKCGDYETDTDICKGNYDDGNNGEDKTGPSVADIYVSNKTTSSITINAVCKDDKSDIIEYLYSKDGGETYISGGLNTSYKFEKLDANTKYTFKVKCKNEKELERESKKISAVTASFTNPSMKEVKTEDGFPKDGFSYSPKRAIEITYNGYNIVTPNYYLKSEIPFDISTELYECSDIEQNNCSSTKTTVIEANKWYKTNELIAVPIFSTDIKEGEVKNLFVAVSDGENISGISSYGITKIDTTTPRISYIEDPKVLKDEIYLFRDNITYKFGHSGGKVTCNPANSQKKSSYTVTCTALGNNGLSRGTLFSVRHYYEATYDECATKKKEKYTYSCNCSAGYCGICSGCCDYSCGWVNQNNEWCDNCCCDICTGTREVCVAGYTCPNGGTLIGETCYYY